MYLTASRSADLVENRQERPADFLDLASLTHSRTHYEIKLQTAAKSLIANQLVSSRAVMVSKYL